MATVRQDGSGDYTTLAAALAAGQAVIDIDQAWTIDDTALGVFTADAVITATGAARHPGYCDFAQNHYRLVCTSGHCLTLSGAYSATIDGICIEQAGTGSSNESFRCVPGATDTVTIKNSVLYCSTNTSQQDVIYTGYNTGIGRIVIEQCDLYGANRAGVMMQNNHSASNNAADIDVNSCTIWNNGLGGSNAPSALSGGIYLSRNNTARDYVNVAINLHNSCVIGNDTGNPVAADFNIDLGTVNGPTWNVSYSIDGDGSIASTTDGGIGNLANRTATDSDTPGAGDWVIFEDITTAPYDLRLKDNVENDAQDAHNVTSSNGLTIPALDITGLTARPQNTNYDVGAYEIPAGGGPAPIDLAIANLEVSPELDNPTLARGRTLTVQGLEVSTELDNLALAVNGAAIPLVVQNLEVSPELDNPTLARGRTLTVQGLEVSTELDNLALIKAVGLVVADLEVSLELDNVAVGLSQGISLIIDDIGVTPELDNVALARNLALAVADLEVAPELDNVSVGKDTTLAIADLEVAPELDNVLVGITSGITLSINNIEVATELTGNSVIGRGRVIAIDDLNVQPETDLVDIGLNITLGIQDLEVSPELQNVMLSIPGSQVFGSTNSVLLLTPETQIMVVT